MVREQEVSFSEKDIGFVDVFPKSKEDITREMKNRDVVGLRSFTENKGIAKCVSENQTARGRPVTPIVYNAAKPSFSIVDDSADEMNEWIEKRHKTGCESMDECIFNNCINSPTVVSAVACANL